jgi:hypothetical protein
LPPYQVNEGGKWFCDRCTTFSDANPAKVQDQIQMTHCLPKEYLEGKKTPEDLKKESKASSL